jgi:hypothetical protein
VVGVGPFGRKWLQLPEMVSIAGNGASLQGIASIAGNVINFAQKLINCRE